MKQGERRAVARYRVKLPVEIEMDEYTIERATSIEVSMIGIRLACEGPIADKVLKKYIQVTPGENIAAKLQIKIPGDTGFIDKVCCRARVVSVNRASQVRYNVVFKFIEFGDEQSHDYWKGYVSKLAY